MDVYEATRIVLGRIQSLDPENASKIMGLLLIQDHGEKEMIRLAFGPESLLHSVIFKARNDLGIPLNSPSTPSSPFSRNLAGRGAINLPNSWSSFSDLQNPDDLINGSSSLMLKSSSLPYYGNGNGNGNDGIDEFQIQDQFSFLNDDGAGAGAGNWGGSIHRRSCSVSDVLLNSDDPSAGFGWKPCLYYARGFCKNGSSCRFLHEGIGDSSSIDGASIPIGSPGKLDLMECHELLRSKSAHQQRMAAASSFPYSPKSMNFLLQNQQIDSPRAAAAAMMMSDDMHKFGRARLERSEFLVNPASRQIYLTFPADSTFREEDVSNYFSIYGPVQDVRIPYQQKRMFGFVTFVYPETVKLILAKGNPHFVCDARVLVKPYKEKGKVPDKFRKQPQIERGEFSPCESPNGVDSRDPFDLGGRLFYSSQDMLWRKKLEEQADLQQALDLQSRRLMNLQLLDDKQHHHHRALSTGSPIPSPIHSPNLFNKTLVLPSFLSNPKGPQEKCSIPAGSTVEEENGIGKECPIEESDVHDCLEHNLPDSPFASPAKGTGEYSSAFSNDAGEGAISADNGSVMPSLLPATSSLDVAATFKSFNCQIPRFSSGHGAIGMYANPGGPTCPVGI